MIPKKLIFKYPGFFILMLFISVIAANATELQINYKTEFETQFNPLDTVTVEFSGEGIIAVCDGNGKEYVRAKAKDSYSFTAGGAAGNQTIYLLDKEDCIQTKANFTLGCQTGINDRDGFYNQLLTMLRWTMVRNYGNTSTVCYNGTFYEYFVRWLRDHVHTLKGMKYFYSELKSGIDLYAESQREDGMIWDNIMPRTPEPNMWDVRFSYGNFIELIEDSTYEFKRIPVEADVEYLFIEGLYYTWKATGDDNWMASRLGNALKALNYSLTDEYRWSEKYRLIRRGFTIDTWDFQSEPDVEISGDPMVVRLGKTRFGIMFGDNTGTAAACRYLSEMLENAGRTDEAEKIKKLGAEIKSRLDALAWNGEFYTHHVPEDPNVVRDLGVDQSKQVSLSNAYSLNRGLTHEQCVSIIKTYKRIRDKMPKSSPGEWYAIYPPFGRGFGGHATKWEYMNGGVTPIVAGELAHGAFEHGFENYGVDILKRIYDLSQLTDAYLHCAYRGAGYEPPAAKFTPLDMKAIANVDFYGAGAGGVPGWSNQGENDLHEMPTGSQVFHNIPFDIIDPAENGRRACLGLCGEKEYAQLATVKLNQTAKSIYLLHTLAGEGSSYGGTVTLNYQDGSSFTDYMTSGKVGNWWMPQDPPRGKGLPHCKVAWRGKNAVSPNVGVYIYALMNPSPEKRIKSIEFKGLKKSAKWFVLAVTIADAEVYFDPGIVSYGIPDNWGAAAVTYALVEGLAGVKDLGVAYDQALLAPRWTAAGINDVDVTVKYEASGGYMSYQYHFDQNRIRLMYTSSGDGTDVEVLLPSGKDVRRIEVNGKEVGHSLKSVKDSRYACFQIQKNGVHSIEVELGE